MSSLLHSTHSYGATGDRTGWPDLAAFRKFCRLCSRASMSWISALASAYVSPPPAGIGALSSLPPPPAAADAAAGAGAGRAARISPSPPPAARPAPAVPLLAKLCSLALTSRSARPGDMERCSLDGMPACVVATAARSLCVPACQGTSWRPAGRALSALPLRAACRARSALGSLLGTLVRCGVASPAQRRQCSPNNPPGNSHLLAGQTLLPPSIHPPHPAAWHTHWRRARMPAESGEH